MSRCRVVKSELGASLRGKSFNAATVYRWRGKCGLNETRWATGG